MLAARKCTLCIMTSWTLCVRLQAEHADDPLTWDYLARQELELGSLPSSQHSSKQTKASEVAQKEEQCCAVFDEAVTSLPTG